MNRPGAALGCLLAMAAGSAPAAPAAPFLVAERATQGPSSTAMLRLETVGEGAKTTWPPDGVPWLFVRAAGTQANRHDVGPVAASNGVPVAIPAPGVTMIGADLHVVVLETSAADLLAFADRAGAGAAAAGLRLLSPETALRVRHVASAKALVRAPSGGPRGSMIATSKAGQAVEIRVHVDPTSAPVGSDIPLTVYVGGDRRPGLTVRATHVATGKEATFVADGGGAGHFRLTGTGAWRVETHAVTALEADPAAAFEVASATLTFDVTPQAQP